MPVKRWERRFLIGIKTLQKLKEMGLKLAGAKAQRKDFGAPHLAGKNR